MSDIVDTVVLLCLGFVVTAIALGVASCILAPLDLMQTKPAKCVFCFDGPCFSSASCNQGCRCFKGPSDQTGICGSVGYREGYLKAGYEELP